MKNNRNLLFKTFHTTFNKHESFFLPFLIEKHFWNFAHSSACGGPWPLFFFLDVSLNVSVKARLLLICCLSTEKRTLFLFENFHDGDEGSLSCLVVLRSCFDKKEKERIDVIKEEAFTKRTVKADAPKLVEEKIDTSTSNPYLAELNRMK